MAGRSCPQDISILIQCKDDFLMISNVHGTYSKYWYSCDSVSMIENIIVLFMSACWWCIQ